jgi:hypothetical protein
MGHCFWKTISYDAPTKPAARDRRPLTVEIRAARARGDIIEVHRMKEIQAYNQWRTYRHKKESFKIKQKKAAAIIASTLNVPMTTTFLVNHPTNVDANDPKQLFDYIDEYFLQNSAVIVSRLQSDVS